MNVGDMEKSFGSYLEASWKLSNVTPFLLVYIRLLLLFKDEMSQAILDVLSERQKQLRGEEFEGEGFVELRDLSRKELERNVKNNTAETRGASLNELLFCAFLDNEENDFFYLTEPMFDFVRKMEVSPDQLGEILKSEFAGFKG